MQKRNAVPEVIPGAGCPEGGSSAHTHLGDIQRLDRVKLAGVAEDLDRRVGGEVLSWPTVDRCHVPQKYGVMEKGLTGG